MSEEKKDENQDTQAQKDAVETKKEEPKKEEAKAPEAPPETKDAKKEETPAKKEKPSNCAACNKPIKKKRWYYRNGKFYCSKTCWNTASKKDRKPEEGASLPPAETK